MNVRTSKSTQAARRRAAAAAAVGNGAIAAQDDSDVARLTAADAQARAAVSRMQVALAAYFIAEKRGFEPGHEIDDWLEAETQIAAAEEPGVTKSLLPVQAESIA